MRFEAKLIVAFIVLASMLAIIPSPVDGCAIAPGRGENVQTASEEAVIVYDEQTQTEHFIRTANFSGTSANFGFLVPTPSKPEISEVEPSIFKMLEIITQPRVEERVIKKRLTDGCNGAMATTDAGMAPNVKSNLQVIEQKRVGNLDVSVLQADNPQVIRDWLAKNGYDDRPELSEWLKAYTDSKWFISAYKMATDIAKVPTEKSTPQKYAINSTTVKMSFKTPAAIYPYREPSDAQTMSPPSGRLLRLYVLANRISAGGIGINPSKPWPATTAWANMLPIDSMTNVFTSMKLNDSIRPNEAWYLTEFEDRSSPRQGNDELYFGVNPNQSPVERPPTIRYRYVDQTGRDLMMLAVMGIVTVVAFIACIFGLITFAKKMFGANGKAPR